MMSRVNSLEDSARHKLNVEPSFVPAEILVNGDQMLVTVTNSMGMFDWNDRDVGTILLLLQSRDRINDYAQYDVPVPCKSFFAH